MLNSDRKYLCENTFLESEFYTNSEILLVYLSINSEPDTALLIKKALIDKKSVYLPKVTGDYMNFHRVTLSTDFQAGSFGIPEPVNDELFKCGKAVCIVPGLAFDKSGNRLGYGKGYYDKYLSDKNDILKIGFCCRCNFVSKLPVDKHDVVMDYIFADNILIGI